MEFPKTSANRIFDHSEKPKFPESYLWSILVENDWNASTDQKISTSRSKFRLNTFCQRVYSKPFCAFAMLGNVSKQSRILLLNKENLQVGLVENLELIEIWKSEIRKFGLLQKWARKQRRRIRWRQKTRKRAKCKNCFAIRPVGKVWRRFSFWL